MKKINALVLSISLILFGTSISYAVDLADVQGTKYETAVENLVGMDVVTGYTDGTFRPQNPISRAEMTAMIMRTINKPSFENIKPLPFVDLDSHWAKNDVTLAYSMDIVKGVTSSLFMPAEYVTYAQAATMLVRALGYTDTTLEGMWPDNFMNKAAELGIFDLVEEHGKENQPAIRGDIALMTSAVAQSIRNLYSAAEPDPTEPTDNGKLADFSGKAIGIPLSLAAELNGEGDPVDELEFLMGAETYYLNTDDLGKVIVTDFKPDGVYTGGLYVARMSNGILKSLEVASELNLSRYIELTDGVFRLITDVRSNRMTLSGIESDILGYADEVTCYEAVFDNNELTKFKSVDSSAIKSGSYIRAWDLDEDWEGFAVVAVLINEDDIGAAIDYGIMLPIEE